MKPQPIHSRRISDATRAINLELQPTKIPPAFQDKAQPTLKCLGAHLRIAGDSGSSLVLLTDRPSMDTATRRFKHISVIVLSQAGLTALTVDELLTMYVGAVI